MHIFHAICGAVMAFVTAFIGFFLGLLFFNGIHSESTLNS